MPACPIRHVRGQSCLSCVTRCHGVTLGSRWVMCCVSPAGSQSHSSFSSLSKENGSTSRPDESFHDTVLWLRSEYDEMKARSKFTHPPGRLASNVQSERVIGRRVELFSFKAVLSDAATGEQHPRKYVRLHDMPSTLWDDVLQLKQNLPDLAEYFEIEGDQIRPLAAAPSPPVHPPDDQDVSDLLAKALRHDGHSGASLEQAVQVLERD